MDEMIEIAVTNWQLINLKIYTAIKTLPNSQYYFIDELMSW